MRALLCDYRKKNRKRPGSSKNIRRDCISSQQHDKQEVREECTCLVHVHAWRVALILFEMFKVEFMYMYIFSRLLQIFRKPTVAIPGRNGCLCPLHISRSYARFTLADPMPRLCPDAVGSANVNGLPTRNRPSGPHREAIGRSSGNIKHV